MADAIPPWDDPRCILVCEEHPWKTWDYGGPLDCDCGAPGMPVNSVLFLLTVMAYIEKLTEAREREFVERVDQRREAWEDFFRHIIPDLQVFDQEQRMRDDAAEGP